MSGRFERTELLLGTENLAKLRNAEVVVAGLGAVGSYAVEALARAGVGAIRVIDFDIVRETNINRQLYALTSTFGQFKVELAEKRIKEINPDCKVTISKTFIDAETAPLLLTPKPDALIDAIDSVSCKTVLLKTAYEAGIFTVSAMGAASRLDFSRVKAADLSKTESCPLAKRIRRRLRVHGITTGIQCIFSDEPVDPCSVKEPGAEKDFFERGRRRRMLGSISYMTGLFGLAAAGEVIKRLTENI
ncbi:MAG: tRNA threonylcarbamoyladenosine dehydratase [Fibrobacteres bacterium]|nr:tRNA threonylcarbamoyladenosine dehydratase [Fibrobacterota bacterium]